MYKQCQTDKSSSRQRRLEQGLLEVMQKRQYDEITVSDLCAELQIPRKSFYRYFSSKEGALLALIDHALMDYDIFNTHTVQDGKDAPLYYMEQVFVYWIQHRSLLDALEKSGLSGVLIQRAMKFTKDMDTLPRFMQISDRRLREYGTMFMVCGLITMIVQWHHDGFSKSAEEMAQLAMQLLTNPLFSGNVEDI